MTRFLNRSVYYSMLDIGFGCRHFIGIINFKSKNHNLIIFCESNELSNKNIYRVGCVSTNGTKRMCFFKWTIFQLQLSIVLIRKKNFIKNLNCSLQLSVRFRI